MADFFDRIKVEYRADYNIPPRVCAIDDFIENARLHDDESRVRKWICHKVWQEDFQKLTANEFVGKFNSENEIFLFGQHVDALHLQQLHYELQRTL